MSSTFMTGLIIGLFIGAVLGMFITSLAAVSRDNVTVTYSGYQPKKEIKLGEPPSTGSPVKKSNETIVICERCPDEHTKKCDTCYKIDKIRMIII